MKSKLHPVLILLFWSLSLLMFQSVSGQNRAITGKVLNEKGEPVIGASVGIVNATSSKYATTDAKGAFILQASGRDTAIISSVGFEVKRVPIGQLSDFNITLTSKTESLNEVVVVGYGVQNRRD